MLPWGPPVYTSGTVAHWWTPPGWGRGREAGYVGLERWEVIVF